MPELSIIVLNWNGLKYLKGCLKSIWENTRVPYELIVVDNNSTDGSTKWLDSKVEELSYLVLNTKNRGVAGGRNDGLKYASGKYCVFLDNDTEVGKGWAKTILDEFKDKKVGIVGKHGTNTAFFKPLTWGKVERENGRGYCDTVPGFCFAFRRELLEFIGNQFEDFPNGKFWHEDLDFCLRARMIGYKVVTNNNIKIKHFEHKSAGEDVDNQEMLEKIPGFYENAKFIRERMVDRNILRIHRSWEGFDSMASYDIVTNAIADGLRTKGMVVLREQTYHDKETSFDLCKGIDMMFNGKRFIWLHQENDRCPKVWEEEMKHVDFAFCSSPHVKEVCKDEPYFDKLINVSLDGIDKKVFNHKVKPLKDFHKGLFKFLMVGSTQPRKNSWNLIKWYCETFTKEDKVVLIIKDGGYGWRKETEDYIKKMRKKPNCPKIEHLFDNWSREYLARVYRTVALNGCYIHPHRAECFGLPLIEAGACGCRIGTTDWGGPHYNLRYQTKSKMIGVTYFDYTLEPSTFHNWEGEKYYKERLPMWAEPKEEDVKKFMKEVIKEEWTEMDANKISLKLINIFDFGTKANYVYQALKRYGK